jgi:hypothetical protein
MPLFLVFGLFFASFLAALTAPLKQRVKIKALSRDVGHA